MEQITYLLFIRRLDELQTGKENKANRFSEAVESPIFPDGADPVTTLAMTSMKLSQR